MTPKIDTALVTNPKAKRGQLKRTGWKDESFYGPYLNANQILHPNLFARQSVKPNFDKEYIWNLLIDFQYYGYDIDAFTETEGGRWLPGSYLHALQSTDSIEQWALDTAESKRRFTLWSLTEVHAIRIVDHDKHVIIWDNINGIRVTQSPAFSQIHNKKLENLRTFGGPNWRNTREDFIESERMDELCIEYTIESYGDGPSWDDPGSPPQICIWGVYVEIGGQSLPLDISNPRLTDLLQQWEEKVVYNIDVDADFGDFDL